MPFAMRPRCSITTLLAGLTLLLAAGAAAQCTYEGDDGAHFQMLDLTGENLVVVLFDAADLCECTDPATPTETLLVYLMYPTANLLTGFDFHLDLPAGWTVTDLELPPTATNQGDAVDVRVSLATPVALSSGLSLLARYTLQTQPEYDRILLGPAEPVPPGVSRPQLVTELGVLPGSYPVPEAFLVGDKAWVATVNAGDCGPVDALADAQTWSCLKRLYH